MEYRQIGQSGIQASAITFGAWAIGGWMWGGADRKQALEAILASYEHGVTAIDTAPVYGQGTSEEILGEALKTLPRDKVQVLTKFGLRWDLTLGSLHFELDGEKVYRYAKKESVILECENCLRRLGTDYIDLFQLHWPDPTTPIAETMEALQQLLQQGKIRAAGVSNYSVEQMQEAEKTVTLQANQVPYSMVLRDIEADIVPYCIEHKKAVIVYSPMQRGLLTGKIKPGQPFAEGDTRKGNRFFTDENITRVNAFLDQLRPLSSSKNISLSQLVIAWTIRRPGITHALVGARNAEQAVQNAKAGEVVLSDDEMKWIDEKLSGLQLVF